MLEKSNNRLWGAHIRVPDGIPDRFLKSGTRRVRCSLNGGPEWQCAIVPFGKGAYVITVNKERCAHLGLKIGSKVRAMLHPDESRYGLPLPAELEAAFRQDRNWKRLFHALTPGKQRTLLYIVGRGQTLDERSFRAVTILRHLEQNKGTINYRRLGAELRRK